VKNKAAIWVFEAIEQVISELPFPILGIDSDNGSEFINAHLLAYCAANKITFTRSRPGNKNDGAHVEQKNWTHVRELVGYLRFDNLSELALSTRSGPSARSSPTTCSPSKSSSSNSANGSKVKKRYDRAATPFARAVARTDITATCRSRLNKTMNAIRPGELYWQIRDLTDQLELMALNKTAAPVKPQVNRAFNEWR